MLTPSSPKIGADPADHPRLVGVAEDREVVGEGQVEVLAPDADQVGLVARAHPGAGDLDGVLAGVERHHDQLGEVLRGARRRLGQLDPPLSARCGALTRLTASSVWPLRIPASTAMPSRRVSSSASLPAELDLDARDGAVAEALGEPAELLAERDERGQRLHHLGTDRGDVDRGGDDAAGRAPP